MVAKLKHVTLWIKIDHLMCINGFRWWYSEQIVEKFSDEVEGEEDTDRKSLVDGYVRMTQLWYNFHHSYRKDLQ